MKNLSLEKNIKNVITSIKNVITSIKILKSQFKRLSLKLKLYFYSEVVIDWENTKIKS